jgi:hypothetical protein
MLPLALLIAFNSANINMVSPLLTWRRLPTHEPATLKVFG